MKTRLIAITLALLSSVNVMTGCEDNDSEDEVAIMTEFRSQINENLKEDIDQNENLDENKDIDRLDLDGDEKDEYIVRYKTKANDSPLRIMILSEEDGKPVIKNEIKNVGEDFDEIEYIDINGDNNLEIVAGFKVGESLSKGLSIYEYSDGNVREVFEEYYSKYILRDIDNDGNKEIIIIKEKEKEEKSYAYLYKLDRDEFENTNKVELDSTLDILEDEEEIIAKLLKK